MQTTETRLRANGMTAEQMNDGSPIAVGERTAMLAQLFGQMTKLAVPGMIMFQSDLFHDAVWMDKHVAFPGSFLWGFTACHTSIGEDCPEAMPTIMGFNDTVYRITTFVSERGTWGARWEQLKGNS